jgi:hypothetical protein
MNQQFDKKFLIKNTFEAGIPKIPIICYEYLSEDIISQIWTSSKLFAEYIIDFPKTVENKSILDLGCGVGMTGVVSILKNSNYI